MVAEVGIEPDLMAAYETAVCNQLIFSAAKLVDRAGIEPATFRVSDGCTACRALGRWSPVQESKLASSLQERRIAGNACGAEKLGASGPNRTLVGRLPCDCSPTELHRLEPKGGFEPPSERYEGSVFPTKLLRPSSSTFWSE